MLVTRPEPDATETAGRLAALGIAPVKLPLLRFEVLDTSLPEAKGFAAIAVTSTNALRALEQRGVLSRYLDLPLHAVGDRTAAAARDLGFTEVHSAAGSFGDLVDQLAQARLSGPVFYPSGREISGDLARSLSPFGKMVITAPVYAMVPVDAMDSAVLEQMRDGTIGAALIYSRRTAQSFVQLVSPGLATADRARLGLLCISETVAAPLMDAHFVRIALADHPSEEAMMRLALSFARDHNASAPRG
jgi:uroporphyrinogen-III synthase